VRQKLWNRQPPPRTFREAADAASLVDSIAHLSTTAAAFTPALAPRPNPYRPPTRLNAIGSPSTTPRTPLTPDERARLNATGGCTYCRLPGHTINACPTKPPRPAHWVNQSGNGRPQ
jgi:hypothetical protein